MKVFDLILGSDFDLVIENGDFKVDESTLQHQNLLLLAQKGEIKQYPTSGVGISNYLLEDGAIDDLKHVIQGEFEGDVMEIHRLKIDEQMKIEIEAIYSDNSTDQ